ncbi:acetyltransferase, GNAT family [Actinomyces sp. oral taxon 170 str. F0386]|nr:acetyltransferase, GNAT family [Actinomyces sp. oral taxon 170 str. F0386]
MSLCALDPVSAVSLVQQMQRWSRWGRGDVVALGGLARPVAAAWSVGSLMPFGLAGRPEHGLRAADAGEIWALAEHARTRLSRRGSVSGPAQDVAAVWGGLSEQGQRARHERWRQPVLAAPQVGGGLGRAHLRRRPALSWVGQSVRAARPDEAALVLPASVDMFSGELGYDPTTDGPGYNRHVTWLIEQRRSYIVLDDGAGHLAQPGSPRAVAFKADVGALWRSPTGGVAQLTGVWTRPDLRGQGIGAAALAAVVDAVRRDHVGADGIVSLYVNDYNTPALALYRSLGFEQVGLFATVLL